MSHIMSGISPIELESTFLLQQQLPQQQQQTNDLETNLITLHNLYKNFLNAHDFINDTNCTLVSKNVKLTKPLQRKLFSYHQLVNVDVNQIDVTSISSPACSPTPSFTSTSTQQKISELEYKRKLLRSMRSIIERVCIDALYIDQNNKNPTNKLWTEIRNRGCQFLGPEMQDDALRLILHALDTCVHLSRKTLVSYVVLKLKQQYPKASRTSVGHVVQLLYRAGCFKVEKRDQQSSLMELKKEFSKYEQLRRQHDNQIILIGFEVGIRMSPDAWSLKLFGDSDHKSEMQSIIDTIQSQQTLKKTVDDLYKKFDQIKQSLQQTSYNGQTQAQQQLMNNLSSILDEFFTIKNDFNLFINLITNETNQQQTQESYLLTSAKQTQIRNHYRTSKLDLNNNNDINIEQSNLIDTEYFNDCLTISSNSTNDEINEETNCVIPVQYLNWPHIIECMRVCVKIMDVFIDYNKINANLQTAKCNLNTNTPPLTQNLQVNTKLLFDQLQQQNLLNNYNSPNSNTGHFELTSRGFTKPTNNGINKGLFNQHQHFGNNTNNKFNMNGNFQMNDQYGFQNNYSPKPYTQIDSSSLWSTNDKNTSNTMSLLLQTDKRKNNYNKNNYNNNNNALMDFDGTNKNHISYSSLPLIEDLSKDFLLITKKKQIF